ncbi:MAG: DUF1801 domain-containing protein [Steroidobacteraceae bacterium]|nr:DUF1801 domain-containing protein [Steroidobacteraceae bacterium]
MLRFSDIGARPHFRYGWAMPKPKPKLLSGGNPQISKGYGHAPVKAYIAAMPGWKRDIGRRVDALIERVVPDVYKAVKWNSPFYGFEGKGWFLALRCYTKYVQISFFRGSSLTPPPAKTSKHEQVRYFDIPEGAPLDEAQLADWIKQASKLPGEKL